MTGTAPFRTASVTRILQNLYRNLAFFKKSHCMESLEDCPVRPTRANNSKRITVLSEAEKHALYDLPDFDDFQRAEYFAMTVAEHTLVFQRHTMLAQIYCLLQISYFKAKQTFFRFSLLDVPPEDITFIMLRYFPGFFESTKMPA
jgi:hypothetical protein